MKYPILSEIRVEGRMVVRLVNTLSRNQKPGGQKGKKERQLTNREKAGGKQTSARVK